MKRRRKPSSTIYLIRNNRFIPFDFVPLATLAVFPTFVTSEKMISQNFFQNKQSNVWLLNIALLILQEIADL